MNLNVLTRRIDRNAVGRRNHVVRSEFELQWVEVPSEDTFDVGAVLSNLDTQLDNLLQREYATHGVPPHDTIGLKIGFEGEDRPYGKIVRLRDNPLAKVLEGLERILQSNKTLALKR